MFLAWKYLKEASRLRYRAHREYYRPPGRGRRASDLGRLAP